MTPGTLSLTFGGHATVLARYPGLGIAFDPMLGRWVGGVRRAVEPGLAPGDFDDVGLVLISHRHADHLHVATLKKRGAKRLIIAVPVSPPDTVERLEREADEMICLMQPLDFWGIAGFYMDFHQLEDAEVTSALEAAATRFGGAA